LSELKSRGWNYEFLPSIYLLANAKGIYFFSDTPDDPQLLIPFATKILDIESPGISAHLAVDRDFQPSSFTVQHIAPNQPFAKLGKNGILFLVGDALIPANPAFGRGVADALSDSQQLWRCFDEDGNLSDLTSFEENLQSRKQRVEYLQHVIDFHQGKKPPPRQAEYDLLVKMSPYGKLRKEIEEHLAVFNARIEAIMADAEKMQEIGKEQKRYRPSMSGKDHGSGKSDRNDDDASLERSRKYARHRDK
jgi:hypothetical protein